MNKQELLDMEKFTLGKYAARSSSDFLNQRRDNEKEEESFEIRLPFQRDRDRVIHSRAFRRLMHKTQVFNANKGDHYRNRLTHTMEVNQIARSIGKYLGLNDELIEAIALGHDLGHTPFGHIGERTLHLIISGQISLNDEEIKLGNFGGFKHNFQSLQVIENLEKRNHDFKGMNLTLAVREGILKHTSRKIRVPKTKYIYNKDNNKQEVRYSTLDLNNIDINAHSFTLEGQTVAIADEIAQCTHDLEDGLRAGIITLSDIEKDEFIKSIKKKNNIIDKELKETVDVRNILIKYMVGDLIEDVCVESQRNLQELKDDDIPKFQDEDDVYKKEYIKFSGQKAKMHKNLSTLITKLVISSQEVTQSDAKAEYMIKRLFKAYYIHPQQLPDYVLKRYFEKRGIKFNRLDIESKVSELRNDQEFIRLVCDHIASMTDQYAAREYRNLYEPSYF